MKTTVNSRTLRSAVRKILLERIQIHEGTQSGDPIPEKFFLDDPMYDGSLLKANRAAVIALLNMLFYDDVSGSSDLKTPRYPDSERYGVTYSALVNDLDQERLRGADLATYLRLWFNETYGPFIAFKLPEGVEIRSVASGVFVRYMNHLIRVVLNREPDIQGIVELMNRAFAGNITISPTQEAAPKQGEAQPKADEGQKDDRLRIRPQEYIPGQRLPAPGESPDIDDEGAVKKLTLEDMLSALQYLPTLIKFKSDLADFKTQIDEIKKDSNKIVGNMQSVTGIPLLETFTANDLIDVTKILKDSYGKQIASQQGVKSRVAICRSTLLSANNFLESKATATYLFGIAIAAEMLILPAILPIAARVGQLPYINRAQQGAAKLRAELAEATQIADAAEMNPQLFTSEEIQALAEYRSLQTRIADAARKATEAVETTTKIQKHAASLGISPISATIPPPPPPGKRAYAPADVPGIPGYVISEPTARAEMLKIVNKAAAYRSAEEAYRASLAPGRTGPPVSPPTLDTQVPGEAQKRTIESYLELADDFSKILKTPPVTSYENVDQLKSAAKNLVRKLPSQRRKVIKLEERSAALDRKIAEISDPLQLFSLGRVFSNMSALGPLASVVIIGTYEVMISMINSFFGVYELFYGTLSEQQKTIANHIFDTLNREQAAISGQPMPESEVPFDHVGDLATHFSGDAFELGRSIKFAYGGSYDTKQEDMNLYIALAVALASFTDALTFYNPSDPAGLQQYYEALLLAYNNVATKTNIGDVEKEIQKQIAVSKDIAAGYSKGKLKTSPEPRPDSTSPRPQINITITPGDKQQGQEEK